jgi:hypothetical protein
MPVNEIQLTHQPYGHTLHHSQCFSPDDAWLVYDTRNDDTRIISTGRIEMVQVQTGEVRLLYGVPGQTAFGPGVGAATFSPAAPRVIFIHGLRNASETQPYGFTRRTGVAIEVQRPGQPMFMDARDLVPPFTPGALRGGTHAHSWSGDGAWISFTYNDYIMEQLNKINPAVQDLRTVGVMVPGRVFVAPDGTLENHSGEMFSVVVAQVQENPAWGSDEIDRAFDEGWIGMNGYRKADGTWQQRALAFQGQVRDAAGKTKAEVFVVDLPDDLTVAEAGQPLAGTAAQRPAVPAGVRQRRITYTAKGMLGPRHWLRTTPDGRAIGFLAPDAAGHTQIFTVSPNGGPIAPLTQNPFPVQGPFNFSPNRPLVAYIADNSIFITHLETKKSRRLTARQPDVSRPVGGVCWSNRGRHLTYNRYVGEKPIRFLQVFLLDLSGILGV